MPKFIINGGKKLSGEIVVAGSKNAVLPLIAASLLTPEKCVITNVPEIKDTEVMSALIQDLGATVDYDKSAKKLTITSGENLKTEPSQDLVDKLRASVLLAGPLLARFNKTVLHTSGGDKIGQRPVDAHLSGFRALGAKITNRAGSFIIEADKLVGNKIVLEETSVTATENLLMAASLASGVTTIKLAATEPHVQQLANVLNEMGAKISGIGTPTLVVEGVTSLNGFEVEVISDSSEAATFITMAAATKSNIRVTKFNPEFLDDFLLKLKLMNVDFEVGTDFVEVKSPTGEYKALAKLQVGLYPKLASDDVPAMSVLATQSTGETIIYEWLYESRLGYSPELNKMGAQTQILDPHRVKITGPTPLHAASLLCLDIRNGTALVTAALAADGESEISDVQHIDRGYERFEERLQKLGANIRRVE